MIDLQTVLTYITLISVPVGVFYHIMTLQNTRKNQELTLKAQQLATETRQATLFMNLYQTARSPQFTEYSDHILFRINFTDWEDLEQKLHPDTRSEERTMWFSVLYFYDGIGLLVKKNLVDISMVDEMFGLQIKMLWQKMGPHEIESRERFNEPSLFRNFEYLYNEIIKIRGPSLADFRPSSAEEIKRP